MTRPIANDSFRFVSTDPTYNSLHKDCWRVSIFLRSTLIFSLSRLIIFLVNTDRESPPSKHGYCVELIFVVINKATRCKQNSKRLIYGLMSASRGKCVGQFFQLPCITVDFCHAHPNFSFELEVIYSVNSQPRIQIFSWKGWGDFYKFSFKYEIFWKNSSSGLSNPEWVTWIISLK